MDNITERIPPDDGEEAYDLSDGNSPLDHRPHYKHSVDAGVGQFFTPIAEEEELMKLAALRDDGEKPDPAAGA